MVYSKHSQNIVQNNTKFKNGMRYDSSGSHEMVLEKVN